MKLLVWLQLALAAAAIVIAGTRLSRYGDQIARRTGLSGGWIGLVLLATVTSLPELAAGASAVLLADAPDVAVGNVLGACVLNFAMIAVLDAMHRSASIDELARTMQWTEGFVGTLLVAVSTTLPELTVTIAAVRIGALDLAIGNLIGSVLFNLVALGIDDLLYTPGSLYAAVAPTHALSVVIAAMMSGAVIVALVARLHARLLDLVGWTSALLALLFFANAWIHLRQSP